MLNFIFRIVTFAACVISSLQAQNNSPNDVNSQLIPPVWHCHQTDSSSDHIQAPCINILSPSTGVASVTAGTDHFPIRIRTGGVQKSSRQVAVRWGELIRETAVTKTQTLRPIRDCRNQLQCNVPVAPSVGSRVFLVSAFFSGTPRIRSSARVTVHVQGRERVQPPTSQTPHQLDIQHQGRIFQQTRQPVQLQRQQEEHIPTNALTRQQNSQDRPRRADVFKPYGLDTRNPNPWDNTRTYNNYPEFAGQRAGTGQAFPVRTYSDNRARVGLTGQQQSWNAPSAYRGTNSAITGRNQNIQKGTLGTLQQNGQFHQRSLGQSRGSQYPLKTNTFQPVAPERTSSRLPYNRAYLRVGYEKPLSPRVSDRLPSQVNTQVRNIGYPQYINTEGQSRQPTTYYGQRPLHQTGGVQGPANMEASSAFRPQVGKNIASGWNPLQQLQRQQQRQTHRTSVNNIRQNNVPIRTSWNPTQQLSPVQTLRQRIQDEEREIEQLQTREQLEELEEKRIEQERTDQRERQINRRKLLVQLQELRDQHLKRLYSLSPGSKQPLGRLPSLPRPNGYIESPQIQVTQMPTTIHTTAVATTRATTQTTTVPVEITSKPTTAPASVELNGKPLSYREQMRNDRMNYGGFSSRYRQPDSSPNLLGVLETGSADYSQVEPVGAASPSPRIREDYLNEYSVLQGPIQEDHKSEGAISELAPNGKEAYNAGNEISSVLDMRPREEEIGEYDEFGSRSDFSEQNVDQGKSLGNSRIVMSDTDEGYGGHFESTSGSLKTERDETSERPPYEAHAVSKEEGTSRQQYIAIPTVASFGISRDDQTDMSADTFGPPFRSESEDTEPDIPLTDERIGSSGMSVEGRIYDGENGGIPLRADRGDDNFNSDDEPRLLSVQESDEDYSLVLGIPDEITERADEGDQYPALDYSDRMGRVLPLERTDMNGGTMSNSDLPASRQITTYSDSELADDSDKVSDTSNAATPLTEYTANNNQGSVGPSTLDDYISRVFEEIPTQGYETEERLDSEGSAPHQRRLDTLAAASSPPSYRNEVENTFDQYAASAKSFPDTVGQGESPISALDVNTLDTGYLPAVIDGERSHPEELGNLGNMENELNSQVPQAAESGQGGEHRIPGREDDFAADMDKWEEFERRFGGEWGVASTSSEQRRSAASDEGTTDAYSISLTGIPEEATQLPPRWNELQATLHQQVPQDGQISVSPQNQVLDEAVSHIDTLEPGSQFGTSEQSFQETVGGEESPISALDVNTLNTEYPSASTTGKLNHLEVMGDTGDMTNELNAQLPQTPGNGEVKSGREDDLLADMDKWEEYERRFGDEWGVASTVAQQKRAATGNESYSGAVYQQGDEDIPAIQNMDTDITNSNDGYDDLLDIPNDDSFSLSDLQSWVITQLPSQLNEIQTTPNQQEPQDMQIIDGPRAEVMEEAVSGESNFREENIGDNILDFDEPHEQAADTSTSSAVQRSEDYLDISGSEADRDVGNNEVTDESGQNITEPFWAEWEEWLPCSQTCGHGSKQRKRSCISNFPGACRGDSSQEVRCALERCAESWGGSQGAEGSLPQWSDWAGWGECSVSCGSGMRQRERSCPAADVDGDLSCAGSPQETEYCFIDDCANGGALGGSQPGHTKRIKCHLDDTRTQPPMELFWTGPSGEKITHLMAQESSKYRIEGDTLLVFEEHPTTDSYHCNVIYSGGGGGGERSHKDENMTATGACQSNPCHHQGTCVDRPARDGTPYTCVCARGYGGLRCHMSPYLEGDLIVLSLMGWFLVSTCVLCFIGCFCCSKKIKKRRLKQRLDLDDMPAEKLLARVVPHIDTMHVIESDADDETAPFLPKVDRIRPIQAGAKKRVAFFEHQPKSMKRSSVKQKRLINRRNAIASGSSTDTGGGVSSNERGRGRNLNNSNALTNHPNGVVLNTRKDRSWNVLDDSFASSMDLDETNTSSIVGNDDSFFEISNDDFRNFQVANAFSVFRGSPIFERHHAAEASPYTRTPECDARNSQESRVANPYEQRCDIGSRSDATSTCGEANMRHTAVESNSAKVSAKDPIGVDSSQVYSYHARATTPRTFGTHVSLPASPSPSWCPARPQQRTNHSVDHTPTRRDETEILLAKYRELRAKFFPSLVQQRNISPTQPIRHDVHEPYSDVRRSFTTTPSDDRLPSMDTIRTAPMRISNDAPATTCNDGSRFGLTEPVLQNNGQRSLTSLPESEKNVAVHQASSARKALFPELDVERRSAGSHKTADMNANEPHWTYS